MISKYEDLDLLSKDHIEQIDTKLQEKLGVCVYQLQQALEVPCSDKARELAENFRCIAPYGDYSKMLEDTESIFNFIKSEAYKSEHWFLTRVYSTDGNLVAFRFLNKAIDDGKAVLGFVYVSYNGKVRHAFVQGE